MESINRTVLAAASFYQQKFYLNPAYAKLPPLVQDELKIACTEAAESFGGIFTIGFTQDGGMFIEASGEVGYDEIGGRLKVEQFKKEKADLMRQLLLFHKVKENLTLDSK